MRAPRHRPNRPPGGDLRRRPALRSVDTSVPRHSFIDDDERRAALGEALAARIDDLVERVEDRSRSRGASGSAAAEDVAAQRRKEVRAGAEVVIHYLRTGTAPSEEQVERFGALGGFAAADAISLAELTRDNLLWRDLMIELITEEGARLRLGAAVTEQVVADVRSGMDASLVRMARHFDQRRRRLEGVVQESRDRMEHQALHDPLTGLPNRALLMDRLSHALRRSGRQVGQVSVLFFDLDRFKVVNEGFGHSFGDSVLVAVAARLRSLVRPSDTAARFGGGEFVILCEDLSSAEACAVAVAERAIASLRQPFAIGGTEVYVSASIGIATAADAGAEPEALLANAEAAMYLAKKRGPGGYEIVGETLRTAMVSQVEMETSLRHALDRDELRLHYQPIVALRTGAVVGTEALLRWQHPERGLVGPSEMVPVAEATGLIVPIGAWVLAEASRQMALWRDQHPGAHSMSVNLSARQLGDPALPGAVSSALAATGLDADGLILEITESILMADTDASLGVLAALKDLGVRLAIDDFGTGYSSLSYLKRLPIDVLKVDRSFVSDLGQSGEGSAIVAAMLQLAHTLGLGVIAEGVETSEQLDELRRLGCDAVQGFLFARPEPPERVDWQAGRLRA